ncbi:MAG: guanylate kinase [Lachnospiraceae bacterium]|nr:guanylate kinase [Lachnospiraceae bacterium]
MGKIVYIMGKSSSGKDTIYRSILSDKSIDLKKIVPYTTRPIRLGEKNGVQYFFTDEDGFKKLCEEGKVIEYRSYETCYGLWRYFTVNDENIDLSKNSYIIIGTLESYERTAQYFGRDKLLPILIELDDGVRLQRALNREKRQKTPKYEEMCRRFLADSKDFSEENIQNAGIATRFYNDNLKHCTKEIIQYIQENID